MKPLFTAVLAAACSFSLLSTGCASTGGSSQTETETSAESSMAVETQAPESAEETSPASSESSQAQDQILQSVRVFGPVTRSGDDLVIDNQSGQSVTGDIVLHIADTTLILDGENGFPMDINDIADGDTIYAYIGPAMTMSIPPQTTAELIFAAVPADSKAPDYVTVASMEEVEGGYKLTALDGSAFSIPADCTIIPYLTRQMVTLAEITEGRKCIIWSDDSNTASKIVLFNKEVSGENADPGETSSDTPDDAVPLDTIAAED